MKLWEGLEQDLNYNAMVSQRGVVNLYHSDAQRDAYRPPRQRHAPQRRRCRAARPRGRSGRCCRFWTTTMRAFPIQGGLLQRRGGTARHDAVVWGYARAADRRGVDIIQNCEVTGFRARTAASTGVETTPRRHPRRKVGHRGRRQPSRLAAMAGLRLPIESHVLQAFVSEGIKPLIDRRDDVRRRPLLHQPVRQGRAGLRRRHRRLQLLCPARQPAGRRGRLRGRHGADAEASAGCASCAQWGGVMDMSMDGSPIIDRTPVDGLYLNGGWCYGGFKATPASGWCFAHLIARDEPHALQRGLSASTASPPAQ